VESSYRDVAGRYAYANVAVSYTGLNCVAKGGDSLFGNPLLDKNKGICNGSQNAPVVVAKLGASTQELMNLFFVSAEGQYISKRGTQTADTGGAVPAWWGLSLVWYAPDEKGFDVTVGRRNLIMREEVHAQSDYNRGSGITAMKVLEVPGPGREVFARVGYRF